MDARGHCKLDYIFYIDRKDRSAKSPSSVEEEFYSLLEHVMIGSYVELNKIFRAVHILVFTDKW